MTKDSLTSSVPEAAILIFGGTTEGRMAVEVCDGAGSPFYYSTRGEAQQVAMRHGIRLTGALTCEEIQRLCREQNIRCIIDAAHPFAQNLHQEIARVGLPVIRVERHFPEPIEGVVYCRDYTEAISKIDEAQVQCLLALSGANTIKTLAPCWQRHHTIFRILRRPESLDLVRHNQFPCENLLFYNENYELPTLEMERDMMQQVGCDAILTKESGESGGFENKVQAALQLGLHVFAVRHPELPQEWHYVTGKLGLRREIEHLVPPFFPLHTGFTTGACATAATKVALLSLLTPKRLTQVDITLPDGEVMTLPVTIDAEGQASVIKDHSDDPDVTRGCKITARVEWNEGTEIEFLQGKGVGRVTLPGLGVPVGGPAINPTPRAMISAEVRSLTPRGVKITIEVEGGEELAKQTFNPRVGVVDGISIIGTSGIVSPLSNEAFVESIGRELQVAHAIGCTEIGIASGKRGEEALHEQEPFLRVIHYGNFVGATLEKAYALGFRRIVLGIMIGKAVKLAEGNMDTHSHKVLINKDFLRSLAGPDADKIDHITMARELWEDMSTEFFTRLVDCCYLHCRKVFPDRQLEIKLIRS